MGTENETPQGIEDASPPTEADNNLASSLKSRAAWGQQMVSPWVQRHLSQPAGSGEGSGEPAFTRGRTALTVSGTNSLLQRLQRSADEGRVWQPNVGSLNPMLVNRFTQAITQRFPESGSKYDAKPATPQQVAEIDLPLAGAKDDSPAETTAASQEAPPPAFPFSLEEVRRALENPGAGQRQPAPARTGSASASGSSAPAPVQRQAAEPKKSGGFPFSLAEVRAALEKPHFTQAPPPSAHPAAPVQRATDAGPAGQATGRTLPPNRRVVSRVEEVTPTAGETPATSIPDPTPGEFRAVPPLDIPAPPRQLQRQVDEVQPGPASSLPADVPDVTTPPPASAVVEVVPFPTRPRRERPAMPPVQRQGIPGKGSPEPAKPARPDQASPEGKVPPLSAGPKPDLPARETPPAEQSSELILQRQIEGSEAVPTPIVPSGSEPAAEEIEAPEMAPQAQTGPAFDGGEKLTNVQRQPEPEMPLREPAPASPPNEETPAPEPAAPVIPPVEHPAVNPAGAAPPVQRQPEPKSSPAEVSRPPAAGQADVVQPKQPEARGSQEVAPAEQAIQRQPDLELPLKLTPPAAAEAAAEAASEPATTSTESSPITQRQATPSAPPEDSPAAEAGKVAAQGPVEAEPASTTLSDPPKAQTVQRQPEAELPLRQPPLPTPAEPPSSRVTSPNVQRQMGTQQPGESATPATSGPDFSRQREVVTPGRPEVEPTSARQITSPQADETLPPPPSSPAGEMNIFEAEPAAPATSSPAVQRQVAAQRPDEPSLPDEVAEASPEQPNFQEPPEMELPLRMPALPSTSPEEVREVEPEQPAPSPAEGAPSVQRQVAARDTVEPATPAKSGPMPPLQREDIPVQRQAGAEPASREQAPVPAQAEALIQRQPEGELPLRLPPTPDAVEEMGEVEAEQAAPSPAEGSPHVQRQATAEPAKPDLMPSFQQEDSSVQRQAGAEPASREQAPAPAQAEALIQRQPEGKLPLRLPPTPNAAEEMGEIEEGQAAALPTEGSPGIQRQVETPPPFEPPLPAEAGPALHHQTEQTVQRQAETELPLREPPSRSGQEAVSARPEPLPRDEILPDSPAAPPGQGPGSSQAPVQRQIEPELDLLLRRPASPGPGTGAEETTSPAVDLNREVLTRAESGSHLPLNQLLAGPAQPVVQRKAIGQMAVLPQARLNDQGTVPAEASQVSAETERGAPASFTEPPLPLATSKRAEVAPLESSRSMATSSPRQVPSSPAIQRQVESAPPGPEQVSAVSPLEIVQREETETVAPSGAQAQKEGGDAPDLDKLARQILPEIKRLLARERDRWGR